MDKNVKIKSARCRMGVVLGIIVALIGLAGIIISSINYESVGIFGLIPFIGLFLLGPPFARMASMVNAAHSRIDQIEESIK